MELQEQIEIVKELLEATKELNKEPQEGWNESIEEGERLLEHLQSELKSEILYWMKEYAGYEAKESPIHNNYPTELEPVLAKIEHINSLSKSFWYEVVYFDGNWRSYTRSNTFKDGEKVATWKYCKDCC